MKKIPLINNKGFILIDDEDFEMLSKHKWYILKSGEYTFYAQANIKIKGKWKPVRMHRLLMGPQKGRDIDHINNDGLDNRKCNLRICTRSQNQQNCRKYKNCSSRFKGVHWHKPLKKWIAQISPMGKNKYLGLFDSEIDAAKAYNEAALELFSKFARVNII